MVQTSGTGAYLRGSFAQTNTATPGYFAATNTTTTDFSKGALSSSFAASVAPDANKSLQLTDVMPDTKFNVPVVPHVDALDVTKPVSVKPADPSSQMDDLYAARQQYIDANAACMDKICDAIVKVDPENGPAVIGKLMEPAMNGTATALSTALNAGTGLAVYEVINTMYKGLNGPSNAKVSEVLTKALGELHKSNTPMPNNAPRVASPEEGRFNFAAIKTAQQLEKFMQRDINKDDVMMDLAVAEQNLDQMAENKENYVNHYHNTGDLVAKMTLAQEQGDKETINKIAKSQVVAEAVIAGAPADKAEQITNMPSEVSGMNNFLAGLLKANTTVTSVSMFSGSTSTAMATKEQMDKILSNEPDPVALSLKSAFSPTMNS